MASANRRWRRVPAWAPLAAACCLALGSVAHGAEPPTVAIPQAAGTELTLEIRDGQLDLQARGVAKREVLEAICRRAGIRLVVIGDLSAPANLQLGGLTVEQGIRRIAGDAALVMRYARPTRDAGELAEVRVYAGVRGDPQLVPPPPRAARGNEPAEDSASARADDEPDRPRAIRRSPTMHGPPSGTRMQDRIDALARGLVGDEDPDRRVAAARALAGIGGEEAASALTGGLGDPAPDVRAAVVDSLGAIGGEQATRALGEVLFGDDDPEIRLLAVYQLASLPGAPARALVEAAAGDSDQSVREAAEHVLSTAR